MEDRFVVDGVASAPVKVTLSKSPNAPCISLRNDGPRNAISVNGKSFRFGPGDRLEFCAEVEPEIHLPGGVVLPARFHWELVK